jgi:hypothetical protein
MKRHLLIVLAAGLLLLSATACKKDPNGTETTPDTGVETTGSYIQVDPTTDPDTNADTDPVTQPEADTAPDPSEDNPTFTDSTKEIVIVSGVATVRTSTKLTNDNAVGWPKEGKTFTITGESQNWYRIKYTYEVNGNEQEQDCYIAKTVAGETSVFESFTDIEGDGELVKVTATSLNVRSYPSADYSVDVAVRGTLAKDAQVKRVAVSENWSRILFEVKSETETNTDGSAVNETKEYYVSNKYITPVEAATTDGETTADPAANEQ